jgi:hypothetical protein
MSAMPQSQNANRPPKLSFPKCSLALPSCLGSPTLVLEPEHLNGDLKVGRKRLGRVESARDDLLDDLELALADVLQLEQAQLVLGIGREADLTPEATKVVSSLRLLLHLRSSLLLVEIHVLDRVDQRRLADSRDVPLAMNEILVSVYSTAIDGEEKTYLEEIKRYTRLGTQCMHVVPQERILGEMSFADGLVSVNGARVHKGQLITRHGHGNLGCIHDGLPVSSPHGKIVLLRGREAGASHASGMKTLEELLVERRNSLVMLRIGECAAQRLNKTLGVVVQHPTLTEADHLWSMPRKLLEGRDVELIRALGAVASKGSLERHTSAARRRRHRAVGRGGDKTTGRTQDKGGRLTRWGDSA